MHTERPLTSAETGILHGLVREGQVRKKHLPPRVTVGLDSMGPMRDPTTDALFPGAAETLGRFSETLRDTGMILVVATNGPDIEGVDILRALTVPVAAFAVTEGGGKLISRNPSGEFEFTVLADERELRRLHELEERVKQNPFMHALLESKIQDERGPAIRTPYDTNIVLTLPTDYQTFHDRVHTFDIELVRVIPDVDGSNYVNKVLDYARGQYADAMRELSLDEAATVLVKAQNRRVYVMPQHTHDGRELNKRSGAERGSQMLYYGNLPYPYELENSVYIADKAVDKTGEGQQVIGASERTMIIGGVSYILSKTPPDPDINVLHLNPITDQGRTVYFPEVSCRLAINVTMDDVLPRMDAVEGVPILHIGSGQKALEAISELYRQLHE